VCGKIDTNKEKTMPVDARVCDYMHQDPLTITADETLGAAASTMSDNHIRHLPVTQDGELVGILSEREINLVKFIPDGLSLKITDVMSPTVFAVGPTTYLRDVVRTMAKEKYGAVVVQEMGGKIVGIFTAIDALRILADLL